MPSARVTPRSAWRTAALGMTPYGW